VGDPSYRTVKGILAVGADQHTPPTADTDARDTASAATPAHLHGPDRLFAHLDGEDINSAVRHGHDRDRDDGAGPDEAADEAVSA
jgi:hypothetical protein